MVSISIVVGLGCYGGIPNNRAVASKPEAIPTKEFEDKPSGFDSRTSTNCGFVRTRKPQSRNTLRLFVPKIYYLNEVYTMKKGSVVTCNKCGKNYYYESTGNPWPGGKDRETAYCPYCKAEGPSEMISGVIYTYKLDDNGNPIR